MSNAGNFYEVIAQSLKGPKPSLLAQGLQNNIGNPYIARQISNQGRAVLGAGPAPTPRVTMDVLKNHAAFTEPLSTIENMWRVKYGTEWVSEKDVYYGGDEFYVLAMHRLSQSSRLERFMLSDTYDYVVRLPE